MLIKELLPKDPTLCTTDASLMDLVKLMADNECGCIPIVESKAHKNPIGVVTEHDICHRAVAKGLNPLRTTAGRVMNGNFQTVSSEASLEEGRRLLQAGKARHLVVVNDRNECCGVIPADRLTAFAPKKDVVIIPDSISDRAVEINYLDRIF